MVKRSRANIDDDASSRRANATPDQSEISIAAAKDAIDMHLDAIRNGLLPGFTVSREVVDRLAGMSNI
jgi:hypothetical protein